MNDFRDNTSNLGWRRPYVRLGLACLLCLQIATCCLSLIHIATLYSGYHLVMFDKARICEAMLHVALFAVASVLFIFGHFSFGYFLGFYFYTMILGYLWIVEFSPFQYDHTLATISAFASAIAFLVPALFITSPVRQRLVLSAWAFDNLLSLILILATTVIAAGALYNFSLVGLEEIYNLRNDIEFPVWLRYAIGITSNAFLPFAFACFVTRGNRWRAGAALLLLLLFYPISLTKLALFGPFWLLFLTLLSRFFDSRISALLSLFLPILLGTILMILVESNVLQHALIYSYFANVNFRMVAIPSIALDVYSHFFSTHDQTYYCQILFLKPFVSCPYDEYLSVVMAKAYHLGNLNASLFATEGIASVGPVLAPLAALGCGLVISIANRLSSDLPSEFVLLSGGILPLVFLNVPLTTTLLTGGAAFLFLLWYVTPRTMFEPNAGVQTAN
jgi:hypothetical protein